MDLLGLHGRQAVPGGVLMEITIGHACPDCGSQYLISTEKGRKIICDRCGWTGTFDELKEVKVSV
jgi:ribosomal protein S27AE